MKMKHETQLGYNVSLRITDNCNLSCRHCAYACGPNQETMSLGNIRQVIDNLSQNTRDLLITGGEIFTVKNTLYETLAYVQSRKDLSGKPGFKLVVQSNGFWAINSNYAYRTVHELYELGVDAIRIASRDKFHREQGFDLTKAQVSALQAIEQKINKENQDKNREYFIIRFQGAELAAPIGRAKHLNKEYIYPTQCLISHHFDSLSSSWFNDINISPEGLAYLCCWEISPALGNVIDEHIDDIVKKAIDNPILGLLMKKKDLKTVAIQLGRYNLKKDEVYEKDPCTLCEDVFRDFKIQ